MHVPAPRPYPPAPTDRNPMTWSLIKVCPECAGPIVRASGCLSCAQCGWGRCE
jgi:hypothetical protein